MNDLLAFDTRLFLALNNDMGYFMDQLMWNVSKTWPWIPIYALLLYTIYKKFPVREFVLIVICISLNVLLSDRISVEFFKEIFLRLRPSREPSLAGMVHHVRDHNGNFYIGGLYGFLSSHATNYAAIVTFYLMLMRPTKWWTKALLFSWALLIGYSRIYLGVHYPGDVICGYLLGILIACFTYWLCRLASSRMKVFRR